MERGVIRLSPRPDPLQDFVPARLSRDPSGALQVEWVHLDDQGFIEPFFHETLARNARRPFNQLFRPHTSLDALIERAETRPGLAPAGFVFHVSRCGSTLLWRMLSQLPGALALSEPSPLDAIIRATDLEPEKHLKAIRAMVSALSQTLPGSDKLFIKLDAWSIVHQPLIRAAFPQTPWLFLYREPLEVLVSHVRSPGMHMVPTFVPAALFGIEADAVPNLDYRARVLGSIYAAGLRHHRPGETLLLDYSELPEAGWARMARHFGIDGGDQDLADLSQVVGIDAKRGGAFTADVESKRREASDEVRAAADRWMRPAYAALELQREKQVEA